jgi:hypothetical protein
MVVVVVIIGHLHILVVEKGCCLVVVAALA